MNSKSEINLRLTLICVCLEFLSVGEATKTFQSKDDITFLNGAIRNNYETLKHKLNKDESENIWFSWHNVPLIPIVYPTSPSFPDGPCKQQAQLYLRELHNETLWATQMYDASTKFPDGILAGNTRHLGNFDLCYNLKVPLSPYNNEELPLAEQEITGKYCLVDIEYQKKGLPPPIERYDFNFDPQGSVWEAIREKGDFRRKKRYLLQMALCVPEVCTSEDIEAALQEPFAKAGVNKNMDFNVSVKRHFCQALKDAPRLSRGAIIYCFVFVLLLTLVGLGTWYDCSMKEYKENTGSTINDLAQCFSARRNIKSLMEIRTNHPGLDTIHLMRLLYVSVVIFGHRVLVYCVSPVVNLSYAESMSTYQTVRTVIVAAPQAMEGCLAIGGILTSYNILRHLDENKNINFFEAIILRFIRLTPLYAMVVFFNILVLPSMGTGPYWEWKIGRERDSCAHYWWANLLYINNYVNPEKICLPHTWYSSVDFQLYTLAIFVTYAFWRMPRKYGFIFLFLVIICGCVVPFVNTYFYNVDPIIIGSLSVDEIREFPYFTNHYVKTHERITSYFIGVFAGAIINDHNHKPWRLGKVASHILLITITMTFGVGTLLSSDKYYDPNQSSGRLEAALHACLFKGGFAIVCSFTVVLMTVGDGLRIYKNLLTPGWVQPLAKLTYGAYLVHYTIQLYDTGVTRVGKQFSFHNWVWHIVPDAVFSFSLALLLSLAIEGPFINIVKRLVRKSTNSEPFNKKTTEVKKTD